jgi:hypothetical protein
MMDTILCLSRVDDPPFATFIPFFHEHMVIKNPLLELASTTIWVARGGIHRPVRGFHIDSGRQFSDIGPIQRDGAQMPEQFSRHEHNGDWDIVKSVTDFFHWGHKERPQPQFDKPLIQPNSAAIEQYRKLHETPSFTPGNRIELRPNAARPGDRSVASIELRYGDPDFDRKLQASDARSLTITGMPATVKLHHWMDDNGFFFWLENSADAGKRHYYKSNLHEIWVNGKAQDVDQQRKAVSDAFMAQKSKELGNMGFGGYSGTTDVLSYYRNLGKLSRQVLDKQESFLREGARTSNDPLYRVYLSDVLVTQAMQPIIDSFDPVKGSTRFDSPETIKKLDEAIEQTRIAQRMSRDYFGRTGRSEPPAQLAYPIAPLYMYMGDPYFAFASTLYQAQRREVAYTYMRELLKSGALNGIEILPPALPPKR